MLHFFRCLRFLWLLLLVLTASVYAQNAPPLQLANVYRMGIPLGDYLVSEKYDGMRAYWDGSQLWTRGGERIHAPAWFVHGWSKTPMDGELWAGRGRFQETVSITRRHMPDEEAWRRIRYMVFDLPAHTGRFDERQSALHIEIKRIARDWVQAVPQKTIADHAALMRLLDKTVAEGGEGLMLRLRDSSHRAERNDDLLKVKTHEDAEARVLGYVPGKGKHEGRMGALLVESANGKRFRLGTGFKDHERNAPPAIGSWVTYRYRGLNDSGIPRFASFLRVRTDMPMAADGVESQNDSAR